MTNFIQERRVFERLKKDCSHTARSQYEQAIAVLLKDYNTTIYENRFIVGGCVKVFTYALLRSAGIECELYENQEQSGDIRIVDGGQLSVKSTFTGGPATVKLINKLGSGPRKWNIATIFVVSEIGLVFGAPDMVSFAHIKDVKDGIVITKRGIESLIQDPSNVIEMNIAKKPPSESTRTNLKDNTAKARQILSEIQGAELLKFV